MQKQLLNAGKWGICVAAAMLALLATGCGKPPVNEALTMIPKDVVAIINVNVKKVLEAETVKEAFKAPEKMDVLAETGVKLEQDIDSLCLGIGTVDLEPVPFFVFNGRFDRKIIEEMIRKKDDFKEGLTHNDVTVLVWGPEGYPTVLGLLKDDFLVMSTAVDNVKAMIDLAKGGKGNALENRELAETCGDFKLEQSVWAGMIMTEEIKNTLAEDPELMPLTEAKSLLLTLDMPEEGLDIALKVMCQTDEAASKIAPLLEKLRADFVGLISPGPDGEMSARAKELTELIKIESEKKLATLKASFSKEQLAKLSETATKEVEMQ